MDRLAIWPDFRDDWIVHDDADILVLDPAQTTRIANADQLSRAAYTPFDGMQVQGRLTAVYLRGVQVDEMKPAGQVIGDEAHGLA